MNILFLSRYGEGADIAFRMILDGHKVRLWIEDAKFKENADGLVPKVVDWRPHVQWADLAVFDYNSKALASIWDQIHKEVPCFGGSVFGHRLEDDRAFARAIMDRCGLPALESKSFKTLKEAHAHLKSHPVPHAVKPSGSKVEKHHLIVGRRPDNSDALNRLELLMEQSLPVDSVEVEEKKDGVEVGLSGWFNGLDWVGPININFEHKRSHDREAGYLTGEMGTLCRYVEDPDLPLFRETLDKVKPLLRAANYRGQIDLNMIIGRDPQTGERFIAPLEFTPRIGYPAWALEDELHVTPWADLLMACAVGRQANFQVRFEWAVGVVLAAFGFPFDDKVNSISKGRVVEGLDEHSLEHLHPMNLRLNKKGQFCVSAGAGYVLVATGRGEKIHDAKERAYQALSVVSLDDGFNRWDISDKISPWKLDELEILPLEEAAR